MQSEPKISTGACRTAVYMMTRNPPTAVYRPVVKASDKAITQKTSTCTPSSVT